MWKRKPYGSDLIPSRVTRVYETACDVEVGDGVTVEEDISAMIKPGKCHDREQERKRGDKGEFAAASALFFSPAFKAVRVQLRAAGTDKLSQDESGCGRA
jgi:hypothetical protein